MNSLKIFDISLKTIATFIVFYERWHYGPVSVYTGAFDAIIIYAIWRFGALNVKS